MSVVRPSGNIAKYTKYGNYQIKKHIINKKCKQIGNNIREVRNIFTIYFNIKIVGNLLYKALKMFGFIFM